jgi:hypothetical protein
VRLRGRRKRRVVTAAVVVASLAVFAVQWANAPRVDASRAVERQLGHVQGDLYLGETFEGLPLRRVRPFLYSDCMPGKPHLVPCAWVRVDRGRVTGDDPRQVARARAKLRRVA